MFYSLIALFILGALIVATGFTTLLVGADQRHWGAVAVLIGSVLVTTSAILVDAMGRP